MSRINVARGQCYGRFGRGSGRSVRSPLAARLSPFRLLLVLLCASLLAAGCARPSSTGSTGGAGSKYPASDVGITATQIHVAIIADVDTPVAPGLFQRAVNVMRAWASLVNEHGGLAGRKVVVDFCDSKLDPTASNNCVLQACTHDFALVGTDALALSNTQPIDSCENSQGQAVGIPNLPGSAFVPMSCDKDTFLTSLQPGAYCATLSKNPQTYGVNMGAYRYFMSQTKNLHGISLYTSTTTLKILSLPTFQEGTDLGVKPDGQGVYPVMAPAPQSAFTPEVLAIKKSGSNFDAVDTTIQNVVEILREAQQQGVTSVKYWLCSSGCYDPTYIPTGGSAVDNTYVALPNLPFLTEYKSNAALSTLVAKVGGVKNLDNVSISSYIEALLFQNAVDKVVASGKTLNRKSLFTALSGEHSFTADGIIGPTDVGRNLPSPCVVIVAVKDGAWQRIYPKTAGTFDCNSSNLEQINMNIASQ